MGIDNLSEDLVLASSSSGFLAQRLGTGDWANTGSSPHSVTRAHEFFGRK